MPRKPLERSNFFPYHITVRANNKEAFAAPLPDVWKFIENECFAITHLHGVQIQSVVLMPNHLHMIATTPDQNLGEAMRDFLTRTSKQINKRSQRSGHTFGGPYYWSMIHDLQYFAHAFKYVYRNPVRSKICSRVEDYPFSTLSGLLGQNQLAIPIHFPKLGDKHAFPLSEPFELLEWLNTPFSTESESLIRTGLTRKVFGALRDRRTRESILIRDERIL